MGPRSCSLSRLCPLQFESSQPPALLVCATYTLWCYQTNRRLLELLEIEIDLHVLHGLAFKSSACKETLKNYVIFWALYVSHWKRVFPSGWTLVAHLCRLGCFSLSCQVSWCTRLSHQMKVPWLRLLGTLALYSAPAHLRPSL